MHAIAALDPHQVPLCATQIAALKQCHSSHSLLYKAFLMPCNDIRHELDKCLKEDKRRRVQINQQNSKQYQARIRTGKPLVIDAQAT